MATLVIGDLQGHLAPLRRLLARAGWDATRDRLIVVGDLVNRGPDSLEVLRFLRGLGGAVVATLGNHDIYALGRHADVVAAGPDDTLDDLLQAPDAPELFTWLRSQPLLYELPGHVFVHAGLPPAWDVATARTEADLARTLLGGDGWRALLADYFGGPRTPWHADAPPETRAIATIRTLTRIRFVDASGHQVPGACPPELAPAGHVPWFLYPARCSRDVRIAFGHWAALGLWLDASIAALDTGYVWGGALTGLRLEDGAVFQILADRGPCD